MYMISERYWEYYKELREQGVRPEAAMVRAHEGDKLGETYTQK